MFLTAKALVRLQDQGIDDDNGGVSRVRRPADSATTMEASTEDEEYMTRWQDQRQLRRRRRRGIYNGPDEYTTTAEASVEEDKHEY